jgi:pyruvate/2-oxoglutarate dehydrogenase complex dihydrolipoamide acyltransferase (E2) component
MPNVELVPVELNAWRKVAVGTWGEGGDPSVYGILEMNASKILERQKLWSERTGTKPPTVTAVVACAVAHTLAEHPEINGMIRWGRIYRRKEVSVFLQTAVDDAGKELSGFVIHDANKKSIEQVVDELKTKARAIREDKDPAFKKAKGTFKNIPVWFMHFVLNLISFLTYTLNLNLSGAGIPKDAFGSVMITSIGSLGLDMAFAPLVPYSRVPLLLAVGAIKEAALVVDGKIAVAPLFKICATFDHRFIDGMHAAKMSKTVRRLLETDEGLDQIGLK